MATAIAFAVYLGSAAVGDAVVMAHLRAGIDSRLDAKMRTISVSSLRTATAGRPGPLAQEADEGNGDLDDAPIFAWWFPKGSAQGIQLTSNEPGIGLPPSGAVVDSTVSGHPFRLHQETVAGATVVVGTSIAALNGILTTLVVLEASLLPVMLLLVYFIATAIGRGAASPIEQARQEQLDFTADASHELRTPLAVIEAEVGLALSSTRDAAQYRSSIERVGGETKRLSNIIDDLLWLARLDSLPEPPKNELVDLGTLASSATLRFGPIAQKRSLDLVRARDTPEGPYVQAPAEWLDRLLSVLLDNACRYADEGAAIRVSSRDDPRGSVLVVEDGGPGIGPDEVRDVVRRFHRASPTAGGAGLGLSIADTIVRGTGGTWRIERSPLGGTRVEIVWPRVREVTNGSPEAISGVDRIHRGSHEVQRS